MGEIYVSGNGLTLHADTAHGVFTDGAQIYNNTKITHILPQFWGFFHIRRTTLIFWAATIILKRLF